MVDVQGRVLDRPTIIYQPNSTPPTINDTGRWNLMNQTVSKAKRLEDWGILRILRNQRDMQDEVKIFEDNLGFLLDTFKKTLGQGNVETPRRSWPKQIGRGDETALRKEFDHCREERIRFLMIVLPDNDASTYSLIKRIGDIDYGINTVCVLDQPRKIYSHSAGYLANVALKVNLKLGGINHKLRNLSTIYEHTMVIGIDVTHPSPGQTKRTAPSVAAMVASVDSQVPLSCPHYPPYQKTLLMKRLASLHSGQ